MTDEATTLLALSGVGVPPYSARGLSQTLDPIDSAANARRTINGELMDLSAHQFRKYKSTISATDQQPPACSGVWPGKVVTVDCVAELCEETPSSGTSEVFERTAVASREESGFTFYRPRLTMMVQGFSMQRDEYGIITSWTMDLEEV